MPFRIRPRIRHSPARVLHGVNNRSQPRAPSVDPNGVMSTPTFPRPSENGPDQAGTPSATYAEVDRLAGLLEQVRRVLDESSRCVDEAKQSLSSGKGLVEAIVTGRIDKRLQAAADQLDRVAELVHAAMQNKTHSLGSPSLARTRPVTLGEAVEHATQMVGPLARANNVRVNVRLAPGLHASPAGALYTVVLNALQNAVESVARRTGGGEVSLSLLHDHAPSGIGYGRDARDWLMLEITDDGVGLPPDRSRVFDLGFTTKPRGAGVGLAVARSVVKGMGGTIELCPRDDAQRGATLRVRFPMVGSTDVMLGGAA